MHNTLTIAILAGLGGMIGWGAADFFAKKTIDRIGPVKSLVWGHVFGTAVLAAAVLVQLGISGHGVRVPHEASAWGGLLFFGVLQMLVYWLVYQAFEKGQLTILNPIFASFTGIVALVAILGFHEPVTPLLIAALAAIFAGVILLNLDFSGFKAKKVNVVPGLAEIGAATLLAAGWTLGWDKFVAGQDSLSYTLFMYAFMTAAAWGLAGLMRQKISSIGKDLWKFAALIGIGEAGAYLAITWGYSSTTRTSVVALISGAFSVPTIILAYFFLKERVTRLQAAAIGVIITGIILVSVS